MTALHVASAREVHHTGRKVVLCIFPYSKLALTDAYFLFYKPFGCCRHDRVKSLTMLIEALPYSITCGHSITCGPNISSSPTLLR